MGSIISYTVESSLDSLSSILWTVVTAAVVCIIIYWNTNRTFRLINKIPGMHDLPIIGDLLSVKRRPPDFYKQMTDLCDAFRDKQIFKLRFGTECTAAIFTADQVEKLLRSYEFLTKSRRYNFLHRWLGTGLLTSTGSLWKSRRRILTPSFHFNILKGTLDTMNSHATNLRDKLLADCDSRSSDEAFDIFEDLTLASLDIIGEAAMGVQFDALHNRGSPYVTAVFLAKDSISQRQRSPWLWPYCVFNNLPIGRAVNNSIRVMHEFAYKVIGERREARHFADNNETRYKVFLDTLLDCTDADGQPLTDEDIREEVDTFMFEGHDTVSSALGFTVYLLGKHPEIQGKCYSELSSIIGSPRSVTMDDLSKMTYLECCIKESMRIFPPVPFYARDVPMDIELAGYTVPKDCGSVVVIVSGLHRDPQVFPSPDHFDPTRFSQENCAKRHPYAYVPFSAGPRNCIGQRFAMMELKVLLSMLLLTFDIKSIQEKEELNLNPGLVLQPGSGIWTKLTPRAIVDH